MKRREQSWYVESKLIHRDGRRLWTRATKRLTFLRAIRMYRQEQFDMDSFRPRPAVAVALELRLTNERTGEHFFLTFLSRHEGVKPYVMHLGLI